jgi:hypothetical protein
MNRFQVDPKVQVVIMFMAGIVTFLGANALPPEVPPAVAANIHDWSVWIGQLYLIVIGPGLGLFSNSNPGPLAPQDPPNVVAATKVAAVAQAKADAKADAAKP